MRSRAGSAQPILQGRVSSRTQDVCLAGGFCCVCSGGREPERYNAGLPMWWESRIKKGYPKKADTPGY